MTLISWFQGLFGPPLTVNHPVLGPAIAVSRLKSGACYWETSAEIAFRGFSVLVVFKAGEAGPSDAQAEMWQHIKDNFERLLEVSKDAVQPVWQNTYSHLALTDFKPTLVELPEQGDTERRWELALDHEESGRSFLVTWRGDKPVNVEAE